MSDTPDKLPTSDSGGGQDDPGSLQGKGWDILVGGKDNPAAAGGQDPFDVLKPTLSTVESASGGTKDAEVDAILKTHAPSTTPETPAGIRQATPVTSIPGAAGLSAGVTVTPIGPSGPVSPPASTSPTAPSIVEVGGPTPAAAPVAAPVPTAPPILPVPPPAAPIVSAIPLVPAPRLTASPMNVSPAAPIPPIAGVSGYGLTTPFELDDPFSTQSDTPLTFDTEDLKPDGVLEKMLLTPARVSALWDDISTTYDMVVNDVRGHFKTTEQAIIDLRKARELLLAGVENYDNAEELVAEVKARLRLEEKVRQWSGTRGVWLAIYLVLWLLLLSLGSTGTTKAADVAAYFKLPLWMGETYFPALCGALGGVIGALWVLVKHTTRNRDFDPIHTMWYVTNPFMGGALGVVTYFIVRGGGWLVTQVASNGDFSLTPPVALSLYAICIVVGFNQNILWALIDRFVKAIIPQKEEAAATDLKPEGVTVSTTSSASVSQSK